MANSLPCKNLSKQKKGSGPSNRKLTKQVVAEAMEALHRAGEAITTTGLYAKLGRKGSLSTLIKLKREIEAEAPADGKALKLSSVLGFIAKCDRVHLPAIEEAIARRRRIMRYVQDQLQLEVDDDDPEWSDIRLLVGATRDLRGFWTAPRTINAFDSLLVNGFICVEKAAVRKLLMRLAEH